MIGFYSQFLGLSRPIGDRVLAEYEACATLFESRCALAFHYANCCIRSMALRICLGSGLQAKLLPIALGLLEKEGKLDRSIREKFVVVSKLAAKYAPLIRAQSNEVCEASDLDTLNDALVVITQWFFANIQASCGSDAAESTF